MEGGGRTSLLLSAAHRPIVQSILNVEDGGMIVEGFFHRGGEGIGTPDQRGSYGETTTTTENETGSGRKDDDLGSSDDRIEAVVFYVERRREFIVVWRGRSADQVKPVRNRHVRAWKETGRAAAAGAGAGADILLPEQQQKNPAIVFPPYRESYFRSGLERGVFGLLDDMADRYPFCDVVMTGHSFGAALATIAAVRYASSRSMMRVSCNAFGCPRVGGTSFRQVVNSLPNLRSMRVEYGSDPWVVSPEGKEWDNGGHTIALDGSIGKGGERDDNNNGVVGAGEGLVRAYRFDRNRPPGIAGGASDWWGCHGNGDHELRSYASALERINALGLVWPRYYAGDDAGKGVKGSKKEKRLVV